MGGRRGGGYFIKAKAPGGRINYSWWGGGGEEERSSGIRLIQHFLTKVTGEGEAIAYRREDKKTSWVFYFGRGEFRSSEGIWGKTSHILLETVL